MQQLVARGIFCWEAKERHSNRYGLFFLDRKDYEQNVTTTCFVEVGKLINLEGKRVKLSCIVLESRKSGHAGDQFLQIFPSQPKVGEEIVLGVGPLNVARCEFSPDGIAFGIEPSDRRPKFWIDPRILYRLHDQTVTVFVDVTDEPESPDPSPELEEINADKAISNGDGTVQWKGTHESVRVLPNAERLGDGLFALRMPHANGNKGEVFDMKPGD